MLRKSAYTLLGILFCFTGYGQAYLPKNLKLPADSMRLINSLNNFLIQLPKPDKENSMVLKENLLTAAALMDEMKGMTDAGTAKKDFYKCYLTNVSTLDSTGYIIQLSYLGTDGTVPILRASFKLIAQRQGERYYFDSPLKLNTQELFEKKIGNFTIHFTTALYDPQIIHYIKKAIEYDKRLKAPDYPTQVYCCNNFVQAMQILGVDYKAEYNSQSHGNISTWEGGRSLYIIGANATDVTAFDPHDLWHSRLHHVVSTDVINRPVDEACAYLYGGSWGIYTWKDIFTRFKTETGSDHDWLTIFNSHKKFADAKTPLYTDYVIIALIVQKLEKEKGFQAVIGLLSCGKKQADNVNFFTALEKIAGISKANFNVEVEKLFESERP
ncbi:hypothetical protein ACFGVR_17305 [Mucilaginibacter sp. AW1-3]